MRRSLLTAGALLLGALAFVPEAVHAGSTCGATPVDLKALEADIFGQSLQGPSKVGEEIGLKVSNPSTRSEKTRGKAVLVWSYELHYPGASYIAPHFSRFQLPDGATVTVRSPDGRRSWELAGTGKGRLGITEGFWGSYIPGDTAVLELRARGPVREGAVVLDRFAWGYPEGEITEPGKSICGTDNSQWARCLQSTEPGIYGESRAVARLLINGTSACTGWLIGDAGHLLTNEHCIGSASDAANTDYEFMAEGATCTTSCASFGGCPGTVVATTATLIQVDAILDYALVQLPTNPTGTYGFLQLRGSGAVVNERIYIPGHPAGHGKKIADNSTHSTDASGKCEVYSKTEPPCSGGSGTDVGYYCDTQGGSSGSPVVAYSDQRVVALHHCANCPNRGVPIESVISDLGANLPPNALGGGGGCAAYANQVPVMTGDTTPSGTVSTSGVYSASYPAWQAFDGSSSTMWISETYETPAWIGYEWTSPRTVNRYALTYSNGSITSRAPKDWQLQGWNGSTWVTVDSRSGQTGWAGLETRTFVVSSPGSYARYRLNITDDNDSTAGVVVISLGRVTLETCTACGSSTSQVPVMTSATAPSGTVTTSGVYSASFPAWYAFDGSNSTMWISETFETPAWIAYSWGTGRLIDSYALTYTNGSITSRAPKNWELQGWNGSSWVTVDARSNITGWSGNETRSYAVANPGTYTQYRLNILDDNDSTSGIVVISLGRLALNGCPN